MKGIYTQCGVPEEERVSFAAFADKEIGICFCWNDSSTRILEHEKQHFYYPGLRIGDFFGGVNEGMTETRALQKIGHGIYNVSLGCSGVYNNQMRMLHDFWTQFPGTEQLFHNRYSIDNVGLQGVHDLSLVRPFAGILTTLGKNDMGYLLAEDAALKLGFKGDVTCYWSGESDLKEL